MKDFKYGDDASTEVKLLYNLICYSDPLKKSYKGYNFEEIKTCCYNEIKNKLGNDFDIKRTWNILISFKGGRYAMYGGDSEYYFPARWTD